MVKKGEEVFESKDLSTEVLCRVVGMLPAIDR